MGREINQRKAAIIGCGFVGSATAFTLMQSQLFSELVLVDVDFDKAGRRSQKILPMVFLCRSDENTCRHI